MDNQISVDVRRAFIETNLEACKKNIAMSLWQIGTLLCQAKDEGVVPHGEWTQWATAHSGLSERGVQHAMRQARELSADSPLLALDDSKINALLRIPAGEREDFARRIDAGSASAREVSDAVTQYRRERDEALRLVGEQKKRLAEMEKEKHEAVVDAESKTRRALRDEIVRLNDVIKSDNNDIKLKDKTLGESFAREKNLRAQISDLSYRLHQAQHAKPDEEALIRMTAMKDEAEKRYAEAEREIDRLSEALATVRISRTQELAMREAITARAAMLARTEDMPGCERRIAGAIRKTLRETTGARAIGDLQAAQFDRAMEMVGSWRMGGALRKIRREAQQHDKVEV